jgi:hypothetical protein
MKKVLLVLLALTLAAIACDQQISAGGPTPEYKPIPVSTQSAQQLLSKFSSLAAASGEITLAITEAEMSSYLAQQIAASPQKGDTTLADPQAYFRDGKMKLYAKIISSNFNANALLVINPVVKDGQLTLVVEKADVGPLPVSNDLLNNLTTLINDQLLATLNKLPKGVKLKTVTIADGTLTITATITK